MKSKPTWIWYFGDFELHQHMLLSLQREERGAIIPTFWKASDCNRLVTFSKEVDLLLPEEITVTLDGVGHLNVDGKHYKCGSPLLLEKGKHEITVTVGNPTGVPAIFVQGNSVISDESWNVSCHDGKEVKAGCWDFYDANIPPSAFELPCKEISPVSMEKVGEGTLYDFGRECFIKLRIAETKFGGKIKVYYGESREEALAMEKAVIFDEMTVTRREHILPARGCRYVYMVSEYKVEEVAGLFEYLPLTKKGKFVCSNELLNRIYNVSEYTLRLCSRTFFLDGIKRDRWVWSGDAYQSYFANYYMYFDNGLFKRTTLALRGSDPVTSHINTINDYSFYWIISIYNHLLYTGDEDFVYRIYGKMKSLMEFCISRTNSEGLVEGIEGDWVFIDWADMDKKGALCAMQMLYCKALEVMARCAGITGDTPSVQRYKRLQKDVADKITKLYWNKEKGAFETTWYHGKTGSEITRHPNIFAILFEFATGDMAEKIKKNVIENDAVPAITTPYFKFYELEVLCMTGEYAKVIKEIESYWGGMLDLGATTFWEQYDPEQAGAQHYEMYRDPFGKSLCHAWGASPIYLIGRYILGVAPVKKGYKQFEVSPNPEDIRKIEGLVPVNGGSVYVKVDEGFVSVMTDVEGGSLVYNGNRVKIVPNEMLTLPRK